MRRRIVLRVANCEGVSERHPEDEARLALTKPGAYGEPDVVLFSEVSWCNLREVVRLYADDFDVVQDGERGSPEAGVAIAARAPLSHSKTVVGSRAVPGVRMRPLVSARAFGVTWTAGHAPPPRTAVARALYLAHVRTVAGVVGLDSNQSPAWMRRNFLRIYRGFRVLGALVPRHLGAGKAQPVDIGSDHLAVDVPLWIPRA